MLPLDPTWSISRFMRRVDQVSNAMFHGISFGSTPDEAAKRGDFYRAGEWFLRYLGPVDMLIEDARHENGKLVFLVSWKCRECGNMGDFDRPTGEDGRHVQDEQVCSCRKCGTMIGSWGGQRQVAEWFAEEEIRYGKLGEDVLSGCVLRLPNRASAGLSVLNTNALSSSTSMVLK